MKEFMLRILNKISHDEQWTPDQRDRFLKACETYIGNLKRKGQLVAAQPIMREGKIVSGTPGKWKEKDFNETGEIQVGYYHILARDFDEAIDIAKLNPEFAFSKTARIEVRPIKTREIDTGFEYPKG